MRTELVLHRFKHTKDKTLGTLIVLQYTQWDLPVEVFRCKTIECPWKQNEKGVSCVPEGSYPLVLEYSPAFKQDLWELYQVPNRAECKLHVANYVRQLNGCIAPGAVHVDIDKDGILDVTSSKATLEQIHKKLQGQKYSLITIINKEPGFNYENTPVT